MSSDARKAASHHITSAERSRQWASETADKQSREMFTRWAENSERLAELWIQQANKEQQR